MKIYEFVINTMFENAIEKPYMCNYNYFKFLDNPVRPFIFLEKGDNLQICKSDIEKFFKYKYRVEIHSVMTIEFGTAIYYELHSKTN